MKWEDVNFAIKWTLENAKHLSVDDTYLIEKETDNCLLALRSAQQSVKPDGAIAIRTRRDATQGDIAIRFNDDDTPR